MYHFMSNVCMYGLVCMCLHCRCILGFLHALVCASLKCVYMKQRGDCCLCRNLFDRSFHIRPLLKLKRQSQCDAVHYFTVRPAVYVSVCQNSADMSVTRCWCPGFGVCAVVCCRFSVAVGLSHAGHSCAIFSRSVCAVGINMDPFKAH